MSGASIRIEVQDVEIAADLQRLADTGRDMTPTMEAIGAALLFSTQRRFETQSGPDGQRWAPFAEATLERMPPKRRANPLLLRDTNRLYSSLTYVADAGAVEVGTNVVYAAPHQFGGEIPIPERQATATFRIATQGAATAADGRRVGSRLRFAKAGTRAKSAHTKTFTVPAHTIRIPARPYLGVSADDRTEILAIIGDDLAASGVEGAP